MDKRSCCLCRERIAETKGKSRWKKLYGEHFAEERKRLDDFCATLYGSPVQAIYSQSASPCVCYPCSVKLSKILKCEVELAKLKEDVALLLGRSYQPPISNSITSSLTPQKRRQMDESSAVTPAKVPRSRRTSCCSSNVLVSII